MLTVDPKKRLTMGEAMASGWLHRESRESQGKHKGKLAPVILPTRSVCRTAEMDVRHTLEAFRIVAKDGFRLQVVVQLSSRV